MLTLKRTRFLGKALSLPFSRSLAFELQASTLSLNGHTAAVTIEANFVSSHELCSVPGLEQVSEFGTVGQLAEQGQRQRQLTQAVQALDILVQRGTRLENSVFYAVLKRCTAHRDVVLGRRVHALAVRSGYESDTFLANHIICMYASLGRLQEAMEVFSRVPAPNRYMWASIILVHARRGEPTMSIRLYQQMRESNVRPDNHIFAAVLKACSAAEDLSSGKEIHADIVGAPKKADVFVSTCLVDMYSKCGSLEDARMVFNNLHTRDVVTWNAMIAGYAQHGLGQDALDLFRSMQQEAITQPNYVTFVCLLQACASIGTLHEGKQLHSQIRAKGLEGNVIVGNSLVDMYSKCNSLEDARIVFDNLPCRNVVTWNAMIAGYIQHGLGQEALAVYVKMQQEGITQANQITFVCILQACGIVAQLDKGEEIHAHISKMGLDPSDLQVGNALIDMYGKCGSMVAAQQLFDALQIRDVVTWNALIGGYARQGDSELVFYLFRQMRFEGVHPDGVTFLSVLAVCSHVGLVDKGTSCFQTMCRDYGITPTIEHYTCIIDLFGRAGHVDKAMQMLRTMPFKPDSVSWTSVLSACRKWSDVALGKRAFESALKLDKKDAAAYLLMSNIYEAAQMQDKAKEIQAQRVSVGAWKEQGRSSCTDTTGMVHTFVVGSC